MQTLAHNHPILAAAAWGAACLAFLVVAIVVSEEIARRRGRALGYRFHLVLWTRSIAMGALCTLPALMARG